MFILRNKLYWIIQYKHFLRYFNLNEMMYDVLPDNLDNNSSSIEKSMKRNIRFKRGSRNDNRI